MTTLVVVLIGAGALLLLSGIEGTSLRDTFTSLWSNTVPGVDITQTPRYQDHPVRNVR